MHLERGDGRRREYGHIAGRRVLSSGGRAVQDLERKELMVLAAAGALQPATSGTWGKEESLREEPQILFMFECHFIGSVLLKIFTFSSKNFCLAERMLRLIKLARWRYS